MEKRYALIYSGIKVNREEFVQFLKTKNAIGYWEFCLPYSIFFKSKLSSKELSNLFEEKYGDMTYLIIEINKDNYWGRLPKGYWEIFD